MNEHSATIEDLAEKPQASVEATHVWLPPDSTEVPPWARKKHPDSRFYWRGVDVAEKTGIGRWDVVERDEAERSFSSSQADRHGRAEDTLVRRGDLFLCHMPEGLAQAREEYLHDVNTKEEQTSVQKMVEKMQPDSLVKLTGSVEVEQETVRVELPTEVESESSPEPKKRGRPPKSKE